MAPAPTFGTAAAAAQNLFWLSAANWQAGTCPQSGDQLVFTNAVGLINSNNYPAGTIFGGITFQTPAGAFVLNGNSVTLTNNITDLQVVTPETINLPLIVNSPLNLNLNVTANGILNLNNVISGNRRPDEQWCRHGEFERQQHLCRTVGHQRRHGAGKPGNQPACRARLAHGGQHCHQWRHVAGHWPALQSTPIMASRWDRHRAAARAPSVSTAER